MQLTIRLWNTVPQDVTPGQEFSKLNTNSNNIFFETEIQLVFQFWGQFTAFKD